MAFVGAVEVLLKFRGSNLPRKLNLICRGTVLFVVRKKLGDPSRTGDPLAGHSFEG